jgi:hypothetical protein
MVRSCSENAVIIAAIDVPVSDLRKVTGGTCSELA